MGRYATNANPKLCSICQHPERAEIEKIVLSMSPSNPALTIDAIADAFGVSSTELRVHALMHTPLALDFSQESETSLVQNFQSKAGISSEGCEDASTRSNNEVPDSNNALVTKGRITDKINMREGDMLLAGANEVLTTLTTLGRRIKRFAADNSDGSDQRLANFCNTALVNLYVGSSAELRKNILAIQDLNTGINGGPNSSSEGLKALALALSSSSGATESLEASGDDD